MKIILTFAFSIMLFTNISKATTFSDEEALSVLENYSNMAHAIYLDSHLTALNLKDAISDLINNPSSDSLEFAKNAWKLARSPYQQSEAYRFGNAVVDDWEGKVNAWPLDEGLIDYVASEYGDSSDENGFYVANVIANESIVMSGKTINASIISQELLSSTLHEIDEVEANVATGYHAIEFLLWGQDLNGTDPGAGNRSHTDYIQGDGCTNGNCDRRAEYLMAATNLLIADIEDIVSAWDSSGEARVDIMQDPTDGIRRMFVGMGSLAYGELAGERIKLGLMLNDPEEEHDCFSDNTHWSHAWDAMSIKNVYTGQYVRVDGSTVQGPSLQELVSNANTSLNTNILTNLKTTELAMKRMTDLADRQDNPMKIDQMIAVGNSLGEEVIMGVVNSLVAEARSFEDAVVALGLPALGEDLEGSDSLDNPDSI